MLKWLYCKINRINDDEFQILEDMYMKNYENDCVIFKPVLEDALNRIRKGEKSVTIDLEGVNREMVSDIRKIIYKNTKKLKIFINDKHMIIERR